ncbi:DUF4148 domain-containing protein [Paraburkholderia sp. PREW-6R]|uniref:DUF4148 domain-containing protein n=1 Tax=Paraburkholderia sp. PREW-6R TaxID=3141544 RepID=UPI0031F4934E
MKGFARQMMLGLAVSAMVSGGIPLAAAQSPSASPGAGTAGAASAPSSKAQRKAARKEARAKKNAELKKLEDAGYQPSQDDPNYPNNLQKAEKKAGIGAPAGQQ